MMPDGASLVLQDVTTAVGQADVLAVSADQTHIRFTPAVEKTFSMTMARQVGDQARAIALRGLGGGPATEVALTTSPELVFAHLGNPGTARNVEVQAFMFDRKTNKRLNKHFTAINVPANSALKVDIQNWQTVDASVQTSKNF
jgi:hypothetical protein